MKANQYHSLSASEDEEPEVVAKCSPKKSPKKGTIIQTSGIYDTILAELCGVPYAYEKLVQSDKEHVLFSDDITEDDEVWIMQTPKEVNLNSLRNVNIDFTSDVSTMTLRLKKRKKFSVYTVPCNEHICGVLPRRSTHSFNTNVLALNGRILLQENVKSKKQKTNVEEPSDEVNNVAQIELDADNTKDSLNNKIEDQQTVQKKKKLKNFN